MKNSGLFLLSSSTKNLEFQLFHGFRDFAEHAEVVLLQPGQGLLPLQLVLLLDLLGLYGFRLDVQDVLGQVDFSVAGSWKMLNNSSGCELKQVS